MRKILTILLAVASVLTANAYRYVFSFHNTPLSKAIVEIGKSHPEANISFIYKELDHYTTSAKIHTDDLYDALRQIIGLNPVSIINSGNHYYIEALQRGVFRYIGRAVGSDGEPVVAATVMLLSPLDSTVLTYGITDAAGKFSIPCDRKGVIGKLSCLGYKTTSRRFSSFSVGTITMQEHAVALGSVTVEGDNARLYSDKAVFIPSARQKNAAQDAIDLLRHMAIPMLRVGFMSNSVKDNSGADVSIFINYMPASQEDLTGMLTSDVRKVEYLECPADPRFRGAMRAINFIVQEYEYGGYTKLRADEDFLTGLSSNVSLFSKFSYKRLTYDLFLGCNNWNDRHGYTDNEGIYSLKDADGSEYTLTRSETTDKAQSRQNNYPVTLRATYNTEKVQIRNTIGFSHTSNPEQDKSGQLTYSPGTDLDYYFNRDSRYHSNSLSYYGSYYFMCPRDIAIDINPQFSYSHNNDALVYSTSAMPDMIMRNARENACYSRGDAYISKSINQKHTFRFGIRGAYTLNKLNYIGNSIYSDKYHHAHVGWELAYKFNTSQVSLYTDAGFSWEQNDINGIKNNDTYPFIHLDFNYSIDTKNSLWAYFQLASNNPGIADKSSDVLQDNEFIYITGNPNLDNFRHVTFNASYTWFPSNMFGVSVYGNFYERFNRQMTVYEPYDDGRALLRSYVNDGNNIRSSVGLSASLKLFDKSLQLYASPSQHFYRSTGIYNKSYNPFQLEFQAFYYLKQFYFQAYYRAAVKYMDYDSPAIIKSRDFYVFGAGWSDSGWNIRIYACNIFSSSWEHSHTLIEAPLYRQNVTSFGSGFHARLNLSVTYSFGYGKKLQRGNEIGEQSGASSAILK